MERKTVPFDKMILKGHTDNHNIHFNVGSDVYCYTNTFSEKIDAESYVDGSCPLETPGHFVWKWESDPKINPGDFLKFTLQHYEITPDGDKRSIFEDYVVRVQKQLNKKGTLYELKTVPSAVHYKQDYFIENDGFMAILDYRVIVYKFCVPDGAFCIPIHESDLAKYEYARQLQDGINFLNTPPFPQKIVDGKEVDIRPSTPITAYGVTDDEVTIIAYYDNDEVDKNRG